MNVSSALHEYIVSVMESRNDIEARYSRLKDISSEDYGHDIEKWFEWFMGDDTQEGKAFVEITYKLYKSNKKFHSSNK